MRIPGLIINSSITPDYYGVFWEALNGVEEAFKSEEKVLKGDGMCQASLEMH